MKTRKFLVHKNKPTSYYFQLLKYQNLYSRFSRNNNKNKTEYKNNNRKDSVASDQKIS